MTADVPDILYVPLPQPLPIVAKRSHFFLLFGCMVATLVVIRIFVVSLPETLILAAVCVPMVMMVAGTLLFGFHTISAGRRLQRLAKFDSTDELAEAVAKLLISVGVCRQTGATSVPWHRFDRERTRRGIPALGIVVDEALREPLEAVGRPDYLLEPERLVNHNAGIVAVAMTTAIGLFAAWSLYGGHTVIGGFAAVCLLANLSRFGWMPILGEGDLPVAGPGYVELPGKRLTVRDSVLIVARGQRKRSVRIFLTGPAGHLSWSYPRLDNPHFARLWQRWAHPNPRLDFGDVS